MVFNTKFSLPSFLKQVKKLTNSQKDSIKRAGFGNLLRIPDQVLRRSQLIQLMEKWSCEKQAFIFPPGQLKITLLDVSLILGLRVIGQPVLLKEGSPLTTLEKEFGASVLSRMIGIELLKERLELIGENDDESFIRVFLLYCFGTLLFPSANGKVDSRYLNLLQDVDNVSLFAWGAAVLEDLHNSLSQRQSQKTSNIGGCLILLQIWCYEHIIIGRPKLLDHPRTFKLLDYPSTFPRACRWESSAKNYSMSSEFNIKFEELEYNQILWQLEPTSEEIEIDIIREIPQEWHLRTGLGTIEQPIEVQSERANRMVRVHKEKVEENDADDENENEVPMRQEKSTIFVSSDDEESMVIEDLKREILELKAIIEERKENEAKKLFEDEDEIKDLREKVQDCEELRKRVQDENEELMKRVQDKEELRTRVQNENEELMKRVQNENEELRKRIRDVEELRERVQYEEELKKRAQNENEELRKRVQYEEELRNENEKHMKIAKDENDELRKTVQDENELRKRVHNENEKLRKRIQDDNELIKRVQDEEELRNRVQDENEKRRKRVQQENDELRKRIQDEEELKRRVQYEEELRKGVEEENEQLRKKVQDEEELRKRLQDENENLMKRVQDEVEIMKSVQDENIEMRKRLEDEQKLKKIVEEESEKLRVENTLMEGCISDLGRLLSKDDVDL